MSAIPFKLERLTPAHCEALAPHVSEADRMDLLASGFDPETALAGALEEPGEAYAVLVSDDHVLGAFGWTVAGGIWSMWRPLTRQEGRCILKLAPAFIRAMVRDAGGRRLGNLVWLGNLTIIKWLWATDCFEFLDRGLTYGNRHYLAFVTKPHLTSAPAETSAHV